MLRDHPGCAAGLGCLALCVGGMGLLMAISWGLYIVHQLSQLWTGHP